MSKAFGNHLRTLRKTKSNFSQQNMSDMLKISRSTYTYYETGKSEPGQDTLRKICNILGVDFNTLLGYFADDSELKVAQTNSTTTTLTVDEEQFLSAYRSMNSDQKASLKKFITNLFRT